MLVNQQVVKFGQVLMGLPTSGKSTYVDKMSEFLKSEGRQLTIINLDPGCEIIAYNPDIDIRKIISINDVMLRENLGPNMSMVYVIKFLLNNKEWLKSEIIKCNKDYIMIDMPGQVELFTHYSEVKELINFLKDPNGLNIQLVSIFVINSINCEDICSYLHINLKNIQAMLHMETPTINLINLIKGKNNEKLLMQIKAFEDVENIKYLIDLDVKNNKGRYGEYRSKLAEFICNNPWLNYTIIDFEDKNSMETVKQLIDSAGGYYIKKFLEIKDNKDSSATININDEEADEFVKNYF